jgi:hypothetical protein
MTYSPSLDCSTLRRRAGHRQQMPLHSMRYIALCELRARWILAKTAIHLYMGTSCVRDPRPSETVQDISRLSVQDRGISVSYRRKRRDCSGTRINDRPPSHTTEVDGGFVLPSRTPQTHRHNKVTRREWASYNPGGLLLDPNTLP